MTAIRFSTKYLTVLHTSLCALYFMSFTATAATTDLANSTFSNTTVAATQSTSIASTTSNLTSASTTASSTSPHTASPKSGQSPTLKTGNIALNFSIKYKNELYTSKLGDSNSEEYKNKSQTFKSKILKYFDGVSAFQNITSITFRNGSLIVDFTAQFQYKDELATELADKTLPRLISSDIDSIYTLPSFTRGLKAVSGCEIYKCPDHQYCKDDNGLPQCVDSCTLNCGVNGECIVDHVTLKPLCRCKQNDDEVYVGELCTDKVEKFALPKDYIIAIAAGGGGALVLILLVITILTCVMKPKDLKQDSEDERDNRSEQSFQSMKDSEDPISQPYRPKIDTVMAEPTFRLVTMRNDGNARDNSPAPYTVAAISGLPATRPSYDLTGNMTSEYQYSGIRSPGNNGDMRRQSRVRVADDIENTPDYNRRDSRAARDSIDGVNFRKNSNFNILPQRRRSSATADMRSNVTSNPLFGIPENRYRRKSSVFSEIEDNYSKSTMYQPGKNTDYPIRPGANARVFDYYKRKDSEVFPSTGRLTSQTEIYDYVDANNRMYGIRKPQPNPLQRY
ncbi:uncharacterized protein LOC106066512 isoform X1 [Biomphalaria glabrata]|uniref:Uncharacterized protein LOC106066512 isoform X1 n=1 Tax=Biomphalaria glabrata TaxID=6526 RepID=A0A9W2Z4Z1_BIOGL|nr:uncharacterized protein LOC106066512 isoform X1 [Biomphalaria glabrata]XP_055869991.1 uncharacterized protein LOC106066512 isoform X1 [Biomphalaria glabrata]